MFDMDEVSASDAARIIGVKRSTIHKYVNQGLLVGQHRGFQRRLRIRIDDLRHFAEEHNFVFNESILEQ